MSEQHLDAQDTPFHIRETPEWWEVVKTNERRVIAYCKNEMDAWMIAVALEADWRRRRAGEGGGG